MNKLEFCKLVASKMECTQSVAELAVNTVFDSIMDVMKSKDSYTHQGFGTFSIQHKDARDGVNPQTGEKIKIEARYSPKFSFSGKIKKEIKEIQ